MHSVLIINGADVVASLFALVAYVAGYFAKGLISAFLSEFIFKRIVRWADRKSIEWQNSHPRLLHFLENHDGLRVSTCQTGQCRDLS